MSDQNLARVLRTIRGMPTSDGAGVRLTRVIGTPALPDLDPFLMLDEFGTDRAEDYIAGFPEHPHRGFETVTYMLDGRMRHRDNHGNEGLLTPGSVQWMTAGRGLVHSEMPEQESGRMRGFQLWVNLPARDKMTEPKYQEFAPDHIPQVAPAEGVTVKVIAGQVGEVHGPIVQPATDPLYLDVELAPGRDWAYDLPDGHNAFAYVFDGADAQVAGDRHGNVVHLFERDCSVQRNNQKVLEEAPAPNLAPAIRAKLLERGVTLAKAIGYDNLGTVEFILEDGFDEPWFLEMNTRLQVEHPVTEAITGYDLVEWQIRIAAGERLPALQHEIRESGHAIEARITAERADRGFRPDTGRIEGYAEPASIRVDSGVRAGSEVTLFYDSLLAKAIAAGPDRRAACARLAAGLRDFAILGPATTLPFLIDAVEHPLFVEGKATTRFIDEAFPEGWAAKRPRQRLARAVAAQRDQ
ncbi:MAG: pirin family protein [Stenotrophomonas nitritireducens]|uniref:Pirin family protein n=1 Tax=Stenotrophomonas nitritireducens TaxID=83617 RepID=A0A9D8KYK3_9GAMM|nr:pirin family protein [Stenotrophomonas nitritireducens]